ncbi:MAG: DUF2306 domain-containing protein [Lacisediminihabitans sp.]
MTGTILAAPARKTRARKAQPRQTRRPQWPMPTGLILLSLIPILAGNARMSEIASGAVETALNARFLDSPLPVVIHVVAVTIFSLLGAFQFVPSLRRSRNRWHRWAGRILVPAGVATSLSGMWMAVFYPHPAGDGDILVVFRLAFGIAMLASIALAVRAIVRRNFVVHSEWMTRAYAIAVGAGTQALVLIPESFLFLPADELPRAIFMGAAWAINLAVAELVIRRRAQHSRLSKQYLGAVQR